MAKLWVSPKEALAITPTFFEDRGENAWQADAENRRISSRFGFAEVRVQLTPDGSLDFDRVVYGEAPNINAVVYGVRDGTYYVAVVIQARPFADLPVSTPKNFAPADPPIVFGQPCVMGFLEKIVGAELSTAFESADGAAVREALEEAGAYGILSVEAMGHHNPNPTFCATWSQLLEIQVDVDTVAAQVDSSELIYKAEYLPVAEVNRRIAVGEHEGVCYRSAAANAAFMVWLARHPEAMLQAAEACMAATV